MDTKTIKPDNVNPSHYKNHTKEVWEMMLDIWGETAFIQHCEMTAFKYRMRIGLKDGQPIDQEINKAIWYENKAKELKNK